LRPVQQPIDVKISTQTPTQIQESKKNLMNTPWIARTMRSPLFPGIFQSILAAGFVLIAFELLVGPSDAHSNFGTALMWVLWWPLIPIIFVLLGRFWCAICPFATLNDLVQKFTGMHLTPPAFLKNYGIWIIDGLFILVTWADHVFGIVKSPLGSGVLLLLLTTSVIASGAFFQRRTFCRSLCPIGGLSGNYARTGIVTLQANTDICLTCKAKAVCFNGGEIAPECPLWQFPRTMESGADCALCARCIKNCPNDAISLQVGLPTRELWTIRKPKLAESFLAMAIMGIVLVQNLTMLDIWQKGLDGIENLTGVNNWTFLFTTVFIVAVAFPVVTLIYAAKFTADRFRPCCPQPFPSFGRRQGGLVYRYAALWSGCRPKRFLGFSIYANYPTSSVHDHGSGNNRFPLCRLSNRKVQRSKDQPFLEAPCHTIPDNHHNVHGYQYRNVLAADDVSYVVNVGAVDYNRLLARL